MKSTKVTSTHLARLRGATSTALTQFGCCLFVVLLILGIHFLQLLVTSHYVFHCDSLPLGRYVGFPLLTQSCVEFSLTAEVFILFSKPILLVIEILLFSGGHLISYPVGMHRPCEVLLCLVLFSLKLFHSIFHHHPFHLLFFPATLLTSFTASVDC